MHVAHFIAHVGEIGRARPTRVGGGVSLLLAAAAYALRVPATTAFAIVAALNIAAAVGYISRWLIHLKLYVRLRLRGYDDRIRRLRRRLNRRVGCNGALSISWLGFAVWMLLDPKPVAQGLIAIALFVLMHCCAGSTLLVTRTLRLPQGSAAIVHWRRVRDLRKVLRTTPALRPLDRLFEPKGPPSDISKFVACVTLSLLLVCGQAASAVVGPARWAASDPPAAIAPSPKHEEGRKKTRKAPRARQPAAVGGVAHRGPAAPPREPTYEEQCGSTQLPGDAAPEPQRGMLLGLFLAAGATQAGCPAAAVRVDERLGIYAAVGLCGGQLRSIAVAGREFSALVYSPAAAFVLQAARRGDLVRVSGRLTVGSGDAYLVTTKRGTYVLIRARKNAGRARAGGRAFACQRAQDENVRYVVVPPALVDLWRSLLHRYGWVWPVEGPAIPSGGRQVTFYSKAPKPKTVGTASCPTDELCTLSTAGATDTHSGRGELSTRDFEGYARAAAG